LQAVAQDPFSSQIRSPLQPELINQQSPGLNLWLKSIKACSIASAVP
jgi:hypothetical protein